MAASFKGCGPHPKGKDWANGFGQSLVFWVCRTSSAQLNFMPPCIMQRENRFWFSTSGRGSSALGADTLPLTGGPDSSTWSILVLLRPCLTHTHTYVKTTLPSFGFSATILLPFCRLGNYACNFSCQAPSIIKSGDTMAFFSALNPQQP